MENGFPLVECHGGPWDGRRVVERGPRFPVTLSIGRDGSLRRETGYYQRQPDGYHWRPIE
jgi:hypothetical protein